MQEELDAPIVGNERRATRLDVSIKGAMTTRVNLIAWKDKTLHEWILFSIFPQTTISDTTSAANVPAWAEEMFIVAGKPCVSLTKTSQPIPRSLHFFRLASDFPFAVGAEDQISLGRSAIPKRPHLRHDDREVVCALVKVDAFPAHSCQDLQKQDDQPFPELPNWLLAV